MIRSTTAFSCIIACIFSSSLLARELPAADAGQLKQAIAAALPGDTIVMMNGNWRDAKVELRGKGTPEQPITLRAQTPGKVVLCGQSSLRIIGAHLVVDGLLFQDGYIASGHVVAFRGDSDEESTDCRLTNTAIIGYNPPDKKPSNWVSLFGARNRVDHCLFQGKNNESPLMVVWLNGQPNHHQIDYNRFCDRTFDQENGGETIRVGDSKTSMQVSQTVVEHNYFENCDGEIEIISNKSCENIYRHNTFFRNAGTLTLRHGNRCLVEGNYFFGGNKPESGGVRIIGEDHRVINNYFTDLAGKQFRSAVAVMAGIPNSEPSGYFQVKKAVVAFNTIVNCQDSISLSVAAGKRGRTLPPEDCVFANNIVEGRYAPLIHETIPSVNLKWEGNILYGAETGQPAQEGLRADDPTLAEIPQSLWQPGPQSIAIGAAQGNFPEVVSDAGGRPREGKKDIGCFQVSSAAMKWPPLTAKDVGPTWLK